MGEHSKAYNSLILGQMKNFISDQIGKNLDTGQKKRGKIQRYK